MRQLAVDLDVEGRTIAEGVLGGKYIPTEVLAEASTQLWDNPLDALAFGMEHGDALSDALQSLGDRLTRRYPEVHPFALGVALSGRVQLHLQRIAEQRVIERIGQQPRTGSLLEQLGLLPSRDPISPEPEES